jgi:AraC-like DNA-binding protein
VDAHPDTLAGRSTSAPHVVLGGGIALQLLPRAPYCARNPAHAPSIGVALERQTGVHSIGSDRREAFDRWPGTLAVTPAGMDVFSESADGGEYLVLRLMGMDLNALPGGAFAQTRVCVAGAREAFTLARAMRRLLVAPLGDDARLADLAWRLVSRTLASTSGQTAYAGRDRQRYGPVLDCIADQFGQPLVVEELAAITGQTTLSFLRGFTAAIGMTPHAYLTEHRLQAARSLLAGSRLSLADIALACGFSHQSHFGAAFKRAFALTPAHYRRLHRGPSGAACQRA